MNIIDWFIRIIWIITGIVIFEGIFLLILKFYPQICIPSQDMFSCLETFGWGSIISILLGFTWGLIFPNYLFRETDNFPRSVFYKNEALIFVVTLITGLLIIAVDIVTVGFLFSFRASHAGFWWPNDLVGYLVALMIIVIDVVVMYFLHKKILY